MPYSHFSIWDNELNTFLDTLEKEEIDITNLKKWFYERGAYLIHQNEVTTLSVYIKNYLEKNKVFPTLDGVGLAGYMVKILLAVEKEFWLFFNEIGDQETISIIVDEFAKFILAAFQNHEAFYEWRAELSTVKMFAFIKEVKKFNGDVQNKFVEEEIIIKIDDPDITPEFKSDLQNFLSFAHEININMTPATRIRGIYVEKSDSRGSNEQRTSSQFTSVTGRGSPRPVSRNMERFRDGGSPLSIHRQLHGAGLKMSSSRTGTEDHKEDQVELSEQRGPGLRSGGG